MVWNKENLLKGDLLNADKTEMIQDKSESRKVEKEDPE